MTLESKLRALVAKWRNEATGIRGDWLTGDTIPMPATKETVLRLEECADRIEALLAERQPDAMSRKEATQIAKDSYHEFCRESETLDGDESAWVNVVSRLILAERDALAERQEPLLDAGAPTNAAYRIWNDLAEFLAFLGPPENKYRAVDMIQRRIVEMWTTSTGNTAGTSAAAPSSGTGERK